ncbi:MAG: (Fe-S)-binding protein [Candidatus Kapaibacteriota bacterium]
MKNILFILLFLGAISFLYFNLIRLYNIVKLGKPLNKKIGLWDGIKRLFKIALGQTKIFRDKDAGWIHAGIFWGFLVFLFSAAESVIQGFYPKFEWIFLGFFYPILTLSTDIFAVVILLAVIVALYRRFVIKVPRLQGDKHEKLDAILVLTFIFIITAALLIQNASYYTLNSTIDHSLKPISAFLSNFISFSSANVIYEFAWWIHITAILIFMNYLLYSKHLHVYTSLITVFFGSERIPSSLTPINFEDENNEKFGATEATDLSWRAILDGYSCTHCGRCTSVCPAAITGKVLDPRRVVVAIRERMDEIGPILIRQNGKDPLIDSTELNKIEQSTLQKTFLMDYENPEALWQCTTCGACMQECPITIQHVPSIIEMRRGLVMMESEFPPLLQTTFSNLENSGNPWGFAPADRAEWAADLNVKVASENPEFEYLFWVGCAGSYDDRGKKVSRALTTLLNEAKIDFAILGAEEQCNGDPARRAGNEYLADSMIKANVEVLKNYNVKKIITTCPHCFNTLKNEYPDFGLKVEVYHHSEFLNSLVQSGQLKLKASDKKQKITYHDSCYLGRYNHIYDEPRNIIKNIGNFQFEETARNKDKGLCCGAGGAQMFLEETQGKRVNIARTEELMTSNPDLIGVNCPFCNIMISDALKTMDKETTQVKDIAEMMVDNLNK